MMRLAMLVCLGINATLLALCLAIGDTFGVFMALVAAGSCWLSIALKDWEAP